MIGLSAGHFGDPTKCKRKQKNAFCTSQDTPRPKPLNTASLEGILIPMVLTPKVKHRPQKPFTDFSILGWI